MNRRALMGGAALGTAALLAGCGTSGNPLATTITVNLANAQAEATAMLQAVQLLAGAATASLSVAARASVANDLGILATAVSEFVGLPAGSTSVAAFAGDVVASVGSVVSALPMASATAVAIASGLALLRGLIAGLSVITVAPVATTTGVVAAHSMARVIAAPIPIPLG